METQNTNELAAYQSHLDHLLTAIAQKARVPGICLELAANGHRISACVGHLSIDRAIPMSPAARFELGSISKVLLSCVALEMATRGELDIDSPISVYLQELAGSEIGNRVSLKNLLSHTGGYKSVSFVEDEVRRSYTWEKLTEFLNKSKIVFEPGSTFSYTPTAPALVAEIIRRHTGLPAMDFAKNKLLDSCNLRVGRIADGESNDSNNVISLGLDPRTRSFIRSPRLELCDFWMQSLSDFTLSLPELVTFVESIVSARSCTENSSRYLSQTTAILAQEQILRLPHLSGGPNSERLPMFAGLGNAKFLPDWIGYNGPFSGQSCSFRYHEKENIVLAIGTNTHAPLACDAVLFEVIKSLIGEIALPEPTVDEESPEAKELSGNYEGLSGGLVEISQQDKDIVCNIQHRKLRVLMRKDKYNRWTVVSDPGQNQMGIFRDPVNDAPCLMVGVESYRKS